MRVIKAILALCFVAMGLFFGALNREHVHVDFGLAGADLRLGRNPKTGDSVALPGKHVPHFKPGKELRERVSDVLPVEPDA